MADKLSYTGTIFDTSRQDTVTPEKNQSARQCHHEDVRALLRNASVPMEFKQSVQDILPDPGLSSFTSSNVYAAVGEAYMPVQETMCQEPFGLSAVSEKPTQPFYLTDAMVNLALHDHHTAGLQWFDARPLSALITNTYFIEACFCSPVYWRPCLEKLCVKAKEFLNKRRGKIHCDTQVKKPIPETQSIPIYWVLLGPSWTKDKSIEKLDEAEQWFKEYCIELDIRELDVDKSIAAIKKKSAKKKAENALGSQKRLVANLEGPRKNKEWRPYHDAIVNIYKRMWKHLRKKGLYVFFVEDYKAIKSYDRVVKASANMAKLPVILISSLNMNDRNVVTHELIHAFGKTWYRHEGGEEYKEQSSNGEDYRGMPLNKPWNTHRDLTWEHGDCKNDMGNWLGGGNPDDHFLDWAAYTEFVLCKSIFRKK